MTVLQSLTRPPEYRSRKVTEAPDPSDESRKIPRFSEEGILSLPNKEYNNETDLVHINGSSGEASINLGQFLINEPPLILDREFFRAIQKWEGYVTKVGKESFWARISTIIGEGSDQDVELDIQEIDSDDRELIEPGAVFYWSMGYLDRPSGRLRASLIRFRRLPIWEEQDLGKAKAEAEKLQVFLNNDESVDTSRIG